MHHILSRYRAKTASSIMQRIQDSWVPPEAGLVHMDGKLMESLDSATKEDRLPILLSGIGGVKLLGVPALPPCPDEPGHKGRIIAEATVACLKEWGCDDAAVGMVFDTTSSNTGVPFV